MPELNEEAPAGGCRGGVAVIANATERVLWFSVPS
jgi:hypothetical protein